MHAAPGIPAAGRLQRVPAPLPGHLWVSLHCYALLHHATAAAVAITAGTAATKQPSWLLLAAYANTAATAERLVSK
jgi:hypothetical protein